jgi:hypothetical protein
MYLRGSFNCLSFFDILKIKEALKTSYAGPFSVRPTMTLSSRLTLLSCHSMRRETRLKLKPLMQGRYQGDCLPNHPEPKGTSILLDRFPRPTMTLTSRLAPSSQVMSALIGKPYYKQLCRFFSLMLIPVARA